MDLAVVPLDDGILPVSVTDLRGSVARSSMMRARPSVTFDNGSLLGHRGDLLTIIGAGEGDDIRMLRNEWGSNFLS
jgi:hypothetical protein